MKKILIGLALTAVAGVVLILAFMTLEPQTQRTSFAEPSLSSEKKAEIRDDVADLDSDEDLFNYAVKKTAAELHFTRKNNLNANEANCIGYAALAKRYLDYALKVKGKSNNTFHYVGLVYSCGVNINKVVMCFLPNKHKSFFKDHDFLGMQTESGDLLLASPSIYDILYTSVITRINE